jgi:predicted CopG family antitoxin
MEKTTITISKQVYQKLLAYKLAKQSEEKKQISWNELFEQLLRR